MKKLAAIAAALLVSAPGVFAQISVDVDLVVLQATVRDRAHHLVSDLREQNFEVYEDGVRQPMKVFRREDAPVTAGLIIDHSGSMRHRLAEVTEAARTFARASNPADQMFVVNYNEHVTHGLPNGVSLTNNVSLLQQAIDGTPASGQTALYDAVIEGLQLSNAGGPEKKVLIVISDGGASALIYTVGIFDEDDPDRNPDVLRRLADATGGEAFFPTHLEEVGPICERIARDIRNQYTLGYVSSGSAPSGVTRKIRVAAVGDGSRGLSVRTRSGYSK
jgi:Mg-chelatase subunit ChlD